MIILMKALSRVWQAGEVEVSHYWATYILASAGAQCRLRLVFIGIWSLMTVRTSLILLEIVPWFHWWF
jgi:hypothetical protein